MSVIIKSYHIFSFSWNAAFLYDATGNYNISFFFGAGAFFLGASSMAVLYTLKRLKEKKEASINRGEKVQNVEDYVNVEENGLKEEFQMEKREEAEGALNHKDESVWKQLVGQLMTRKGNRF